jgi:hypothetical protein
MSALSDAGENVVGWSFLPLVAILYGVALIPYGVLCLLRRIVRRPDGHR